MFGKTTPFEGRLLMRQALLPALFVLLGWSHAYAQPQPAFTLASEPTAVVLRISFFAHQNKTSIYYTLYGDGRLERVATNPAYPTKRVEVALSPQQVHALIAPAVERGLAHTSQQQLDEKMRRAWAFDPNRPKGSLPVPAPPQGAGTAELALHLASSGSSRLPVKNSLRIEGVDVVAQELPGVPELQAWMGLLTSIKQALAQGKSP